MANGDDQKLREFKCELAGLIGRHAAGLDESSLSEVLDEYSETLRGDGGQEQKTNGVDEEPATQLQSNEESASLLQPNSDALQDAAPSSDAYQDPPTIQVDVDEAEIARRKLPNAALLKRRASRKQPKPKKSASRAPSATRKPSPGNRSGSKKLTSRKKDSSAQSKESSSNLPIVALLNTLRIPDAVADRSWTLSSTPIAEVLRQVANLSGSGLLEMRKGKRAAQIVLRDGRVHHVQLLPPSEKRSLLALLHKSGRLNTEQAIRLRSQARDQDIIQAQALLQASNVISQDDVLKAVRSRTRRLLRKLLDAELDTAEYFQVSALPSSLDITSVPVVGVLFTHVRDAHNGTYQKPRVELEERLKDMQLGRVANPGISLNDLGLTLYERPLFDRVLDKPRAFDVVLRDSPLPRNDTLAILAGLEAVGLLEVKAPGLGEVRSSNYPQELGVAVERIRTTQARMERENHFEVFGLHWAAYDAEVDRRYRELKSQFKLLSQPLGLEPADRKRLKEIRSRLAEIYEILSDPERRSNYRRMLVSAAERRKTAKKLESLGDAAFRRKAYADALDYYQRLLELNPDHSKAARLLPMLLMRTSGG